MYIEKKFVKYHIHLIAFIFFSFRTYSIGFVILVGVGFDRLCKAFPAMKKILYCLFSVTIISFSIKTITYNRVWKSRETLFRLVYHYYYFHLKKNEDVSHLLILLYRKSFFIIKKTTYFRDYLLLYWYYYVNS